MDNTATRQLQETFYNRVQLSRPPSSSWWSINLSVLWFSTTFSRTIHILFRFDVILLCRARSSTTRSRSCFLTSLWSRLICSSFHFLVAVLLFFGLLILISFWKTSNCLKKLEQSFFTFEKYFSLATLNEPQRRTLFSRQLAKSSRRGLSIKSLLLVIGGQTREYLFHFDREGWHWSFCHFILFAHILATQWIDGMYLPCEREDVESIGEYVTITGAIEDEFFKVWRSESENGLLDANIEARRPFVSPSGDSKLKIFGVVNILSN